VYKSTKNVVLLHEFAIHIINFL